MYVQCSPLHIFNAHNANIEDTGLSLYKNRLQAQDVKVDQLKHLHQLSKTIVLPSDIQGAFNQELMFWRLESNDNFKKALMETPFNYDDTIELLNLSINIDQLQKSVATEATAVKQALDLFLNRYAEILNHPNEEKRIYNCYVAYKWYLLVKSNESQYNSVMSQMFIK